MVSVCLLCSPPVPSRTTTPFTARAAGLRIDAGAFFANLWSILLVVLVAQSVGLLIGATVGNPQNGQTLATIVMLTMMLVGESSGTHPAPLTLALRAGRAALNMYRHGVCAYAW